MPDPATDKDVFLYLKGFGVHHGHMVRRSQRDKGGFFIGGEFKPNGLHPVGVNAFDLEMNLGLFGFAGHVKHADRAADFRADP